jgi:limonene-1,2-epoxide hydrolase
MKGKVFVVAILMMLGLVLLLKRQQAKANIHSTAAFENVIAALNSSEVDTAMVSFFEDGIAENVVRAETYRGGNEIRQMLQGMQREGRRFDIVDVEIDGDTLTARVEVSDDGIAWGIETIEAVVKGNKLKTFTVKAFRLELWKIGHERRPFLIPLFMSAFEANLCAKSCLFLA